MVTEIQQQRVQVMSEILKVMQETSPSPDTFWEVDISEGARMVGRVSGTAEGFLKVWHPAGSNGMVSPLHVVGFRVQRLS